METKITIGEAAKILHTSIDTLRRWDKAGILLSERKREGGGHRYYTNAALEAYLKKNAFPIGYAWASQKTGKNPPNIFYCQNSSIFQSRLSKMESEFSKLESLKETFSLLVAITGEIGNNAFDHNLGNWPDVPGLFFGYDAESRRIVLADRGQGIYQTLKRVKPALTNDQDALTTAFTEILSGRLPEHRGNGLKYVKRIVGILPITLFFQSGNAELTIDKNHMDIKPKVARKNISGCVALITF